MGDGAIMEKEETVEGVDIVGRKGWGFFFFNDAATTEIYTLALHDALPIL